MKKYERQNITLVGKNWIEASKGLKEKKNVWNLFRALKWREKKSRKKLKTQLAVRPGIWLENIGSKHPKELFKRKKKILAVWNLFRAYKMEGKKNEGKS